MTVDISLTINGQRRTTRVDGRALLLDALRDAFGVTGPKFGCGTGDCRACTVRVDAAITKSCLRLAVAENGAAVDTIEGMAAAGQLTALQQAFWDRNAFQCGFCLSGMLFAAEDLLARNPSPTEAEIRDAISGNLCRCTGFDAIVDAISSCAAAPPAH
jgi:aerobic-type carbon monoxide dehydrogenase small subunit (CoxS/CutS family)